MMLTPEQIPADRAPLPGNERERITVEIGRLQRLSSLGLWGMACFIILIISAWHDFSFLPSLPPSVRAALGKPPPTSLISAALAIYTFSAVMLILARMTTASDKFSGFTHVGFLGGFIFFYHFADALNDNFWAILAAGITILSLESYHIWNFCREGINREKEELEELDRKERFRNG